MKNYRHIRTSLSFVNFVLFLTGFAFLLPSQDASSVYGQENERCETNRRHIKEYKRQIPELKALWEVKDNEAGAQTSYKWLIWAKQNNKTLDSYRVKNQRKYYADVYGLEYDNRWDADQLDFQTALRNRIGQLLQKAKEYTDPNSIDREIQNLEKRIKEHETNLKALGCGEQSKKANETTCWRWSFQMKTGKQHEGVLKLSPGGVATLQKFGLTGTWRVEGATYLIDWGRGNRKEDKVTRSGDTLSGDNFETNWIKGEKIPCQ